MPLAPPGVELWTPDLFVAANLVFLLGLYLVSARRARAITGTPWPVLRTISFAAAVLILAVAYLGPFTAWAHLMFWPHMAQHLAVMMLAAPLIVLASPMRLLFTNLGPTGRRRLAGILRSSPATFLINPIVTWLLFAFVLIGVHVPAAMNWIILDHDAMGFVERPIFLIVAVLFYYPLIGSDLIAKRPDPSIRLASLGLMMIPETVLGMVIHFAPVPLYSAYVDVADLVLIDPLVDQKFAGAMMWAIAMVLDGFWMMLAALEWWRDQEAVTRRLERQEARERAEARPESNSDVTATAAPPRGRPPS